MKWKNLNKISAALAVGCVLSSAPALAADSFQTISKIPYATANLGTTEAWSNHFTTNYGELTIQVRKLLMGPDDKRYHMIATLDKERVYDAHYPEIAGGYSLAVFRDAANGNLFFAFESSERAYLLGYDGASKKLATYADSQNYYSGFKGVPQFPATEDGDLILAVESIYLDGRPQERHRYRLVWDEDKNWFAYEDLGAGWPSIAREAQ